MSQLKSKSPIRRCVRRDWKQGGKVAFKTKSFTIPEGVEYHPVVDLDDGTFHCDCPDFRFRGRRCKHILRAVANLLRDKGVCFASELPSKAKHATDDEYRAYFASLSDEELEAMAPPLERNAQGEAAR